MLALLFSGQGAQRVGMGQDFCDRSPASRAVFAEANEILGWDVAELCFAGDAAKLARTRYTQPALFTVEMAILAAVRDELELPVAFAAGHSLGELTALTAAGALSFADGLRLVERRGRLMDEAAREAQGLLAVSGIGSADVEELRQDLEGLGVPLDLACHNSPEQVVLAGELGALERAAERVQELGGKSVRLKVSAAFHSRWMRECAGRFADSLAQVAWQEPAFPVVANESARPYPADREAWAGILTRQLVRPVKWLQTVRFLCAQGVTHVLEIGPTAVLSRLAEEVLPALRARTVARVADLDRARELVGELASAPLELALIGRCLAHAAATRNHAVADEDGFERECRQPYRQVMERYQRLLERPSLVSVDDCRLAVEMLERVLAHKGVGAAERRERWQELSWLDRHALTEGGRA